METKNTEERVLVMVGICKGDKKEKNEVAWKRGVEVDTANLLLHYAQLGR